MSDLVTVELPFPPKELNPNCSKHWSKKLKFKKGYKASCYYLACNTKLKNTDGDIHLMVRFYPPDQRKRDHDNMIASFKAGQDGLALAWKVDDCRFRITYKILGSIKHGKVMVNEMARPHA